MVNVSIRPVVTEKTSAMLAQNKFVFEVNPDTNKIAVQQFFKSQYGALVSVHSLNILGKKRTRGRYRGMTKDRKKVIVTVLDAQAIEKIKALF